MKSDLIWVDFVTMEKFMTDVFKRLGVPKKDAKTCADVLIEADKRGIDSHGINRLKPMYFDRIKTGTLNPKTNFEITKECPTTAIVDGHDGMGMVIAKKSMELAIKKAKKFGMGMVVVKNSSHYGIAGYYAEMATKKGMIGITGTNARPAIAPTFGVENMLGTNPIAFAMPSDEDFPFLFDSATSIAQRGKIEKYARVGKNIPKGWVIGKDGKTKTDSRQILIDLANSNAALTPIGGIGEDTGGHKGYGFATVVEILSAALQSGNFLNNLSGIKNGKKIPCHLGHFFMAINISDLIEVDEFKKTTGKILKKLRSSKKAPEQARIYTAGEKEYLTSLERKNQGVPLNKDLQEEIKQMNKELNLKGYKFPFQHSI